MAASVGRGAQTVNSMGIKPMLRKAYHRKSSSPEIGDTFKLNGEEVKNKGMAGDHDNSWWVPDDRTGIYYPKGQEKIMVDVPPGAGKDFGVNWFSNNDF